MTPTSAVFFDVDFTLIKPGLRFLGQGYAETCARHGVAVSVEVFDVAVKRAATLLESVGAEYQHEIFIRYTARIIEEMGGCGDGVERAAREIYADWAEHRHFELYDDVPEVLLGLRARGVRLGLISNSHRPLDSFQEHFALAGLVSVAVSSAEFGLMKPDRRIFAEALGRMGVDADQAVMVGDSLAHDIVGARAAGLHAVLLDRDGTAPAPAGVAVIRTLRELPTLLNLR